MGDKRKMTETTEMIKAIANDSKVRIDRIVENYEQLEKENAELKKKCQDRCDECWEEHIKLTKATELLRFWVNDFYDAFNNLNRYEERHKALEQSEQFLKENEK